MIFVWSDIFALLLNVFAVPSLILVLCLFVLRGERGVSVDVAAFSDKIDD